MAGLALACTAGAAGARADKPAPPGPADLYVAWDVPHLTPGTDQATVLRTGNTGKPTDGAARRAYVTPFFVNLTANLPTG